MRRSQRLITAGVLFALCSVLAGCGGGGMSSFDPSDMLDFLDTKKKLPGNRQPVFPEGVPGLEQGVPKDLYKGAVEERQREEQLQQQQAAAAAEEQKAQPKSKARRHAAAPAAAPAAQDAPAADETAAPAAPPPAKRVTKRTRTTAPPPDPQAQQEQPAATQQSQSAFPAPLPSGSFSR